MIYSVILPSKKQQDKKAIRIVSPSPKGGFYVALSKKMSWFRRKGKYWYFVERVNGKEIQHYIGGDKAVKRKLLPNQKVSGLNKTTSKKIRPRR